MWMEEGQLKKRIVAQSNNGLSPEEKDGDINSEDLLQWLDEAEKEFPTDKDATKMIEAEDRYHGTTYKKPFVDSDLWETLVEKWFKKWFGGEKSE